MERRTPGTQGRVEQGDDDGLRSELGQTLALFGMILGVVLIALLVGLAL